MNRLLAAAMLLLLSACDQNTTNAHVRGLYNASIQEWVDPRSGCVYLVFGQGNSTAVAPRFDAQGKPVCGTP